MQISRSGDELAARNLDANLKVSSSPHISGMILLFSQEFKKFHATRKFRAAAKAVIAIRRMSRTFGSSSTSNHSQEGEEGKSDRDTSRAPSAADSPTHSRTGLVEDSIESLQKE